MDSIAQSSHTNYIASTRANSGSRLCFWCGSKTIHGRKDCPAIDKICKSCNLVGHFASVCLKKKTVSSAVIASVSQNTRSTRKHIVGIVNNVAVRWLVDTGSEISVLRLDIAKKVGIRKFDKTCQKAQSLNGANITILGSKRIDIKVNDDFINTEVFIVKDTCDAAILGVPALSLFQAVSLGFGGHLNPLTISAVTKRHCKDSQTIKMDVNISLGVNENATAVRCPSRCRTKEERDYITNEIARLQQENIIIPSESSWRSQVVVVKEHNGKMRLAIDYASTINRFTKLDAFPVPVIDDVLQQIHGNSHFSTIDLRAAYHQVPLPQEEQHYTAFEADGALWQFTRLPFGVTNGVPIFCRIMQKICKGLTGVAYYFDDIVVYGKDKKEHDTNLDKFLSRAKEVSLTLNNKKCQFNVKEITFLGHLFKNGKMRPDPLRLSPLMEYPIPTNYKTLERLIGLLVYYSKWVQNFSMLAKPLFDAKAAKQFPLSNKCLESINQIKTRIAQASLAIPIQGVPLTLETDASGTCIGATLMQEGRPIAFFPIDLIILNRNGRQLKWRLMQ